MKNDAQYYYINRRAADYGEASSKGKKIRLNQIELMARFGLNGLINNKIAHARYFYG